MGKTSLKVKKTGIKKPPRVEKVESHCQRKWPIMLGSDCSGKGTDVVAAKQLGIEFMVQFATDVDPDCRKVILSHKKGPRSLGYALGNVCEKCDLYTAGFPCQPYSRLPEQVAVFNRVWVTFCFLHIGLCLVCSFRGTAGVGQGKCDQRDLSKAVVDYICRVQPRGFVLENVTGVRNKKHRKHFNKLLQQLKECRLPGSQKRAYAVSWRMVNSRSFELPQNRKRIYIMGARRSTRKGVKTRKPNMVHSLPESKFACLDDFL